MGITRLANVTGLDRIGISVYLAVRPNSRSLSVTQGKGLDPASAKTSAFMEAAETFHAEIYAPEIERARHCDLSHGAGGIDWERLPRLSGRVFSPEAETGWVESTDLFDGARRWLPHDLVHTDYRLPLPETRGYFPLSSSGLASGNSLLEATTAALFELIERDATTLWPLRTSEDRAARRIDPDTIDDDACREMIEKVDRAGLRVSAWDLTTDIGIAVFLCRIEGPARTASPTLAPLGGAGCHLARDVAFLRALTEAAQTRLTFISGSRDDLHRHEFAETTPNSVFRIAQEAWSRRFPARNYADVPTSTNGRFEDDLSQILDRLWAAGMHQAAFVELTRPEFQLPVVRVVVPGLEFDDDDPAYAEGERARRMRGVL